MVCVVIEQLATIWIDIQIELHFNSFFFCILLFLKFHEHFHRKINPIYK